MSNRTITAVPGILVGHATDADNRTGCTAVLCPDNWTGGVAVPGFAPGSREVELLRPECIAQSIHGLLLAGGSAFGLRAADGVVRFLREQRRGIVMPHAVIPLVSAAVIYDLDMNRRPGELPDEAMGYAAAAAASAGAVAQGSVGAGTGARCGRLFQLAPGKDRSAKGGLGSALVRHNGALAGALVVVNALGNVHHPENGEFLAGGRDGKGRPLGRDAVLAALAGEALPRGATVLSVVAVNTPLDKVGAGRLARMAAAGIARTVRPAHLLYDGDAVFALAPLESGAGTCEGPWSESLMGALAAEAVAQAAAAAVCPGGTHG